MSVSCLPALLVVLAGGAFAKLAHKHDFVFLFFPFFSFSAFPPPFPLLNRALSAKTTGSQIKNPMVRYNSAYL